MFLSRFDGGVLMNVDFSSLEIHIAALIAGEPKMIQILLDDKDYHSMTARNIWHLPADEEVPKDVRSKAKSASFGLLYGETIRGLAEKQGITVEESQEVMDGMYEAYPKLEEAITKAQTMAEKLHYVETLAGFRRRLDTATSKDKSIRNRTLRQAFNAIVQGSGAYVTNTALILIREVFEQAKMKSKLCITVHDSIVIDCEPSEIEDAYNIATYIFSHSPIPELNNLPIGNLDVPDHLKQSPTTYRFPMIGEAEIGLNYNDDVDFKLKDFQTYKSAYGYCKYNYEMLRLNEHLEVYDTVKYTKDDKEQQIAKYKKAISDLESQKSLFQNV